MTRNALSVLVFLFISGFASASDWRTELLTYLGRQPDFRAALDYLDKRMVSLEEPDSQTALAILAFLSSKTSNTDREKELAVEYFEKYSDNHPDFGFLDDWTRRDFLNFWGSWLSRYPLVTNVSLLEYREADEEGLPSMIEVGMDLLNEAFYRFSLQSRILEGGHWQGGFHILTIPVSDLFEESGSYDFILDLKFGDLVLRKPIRIDIDVESSGLSRTAKEAGRLASGAPPPRPLQIPEGEISLYVGGRLILTSKKTAPQYAPPVNIPLPGPSMPGQKPYLPPPKDDPMSRGVSIIDALTLAYQAIKDLTSKKPPKPSPPSYRKVTSMSFAFLRWEGATGTTDARATVRVRSLEAGLVGR